jgi:cell division protease FtsH
VANDPTVSETDLRELARALAAVFREVHTLAEDQAGESLTDRLAAHVGVDPGGLPVLSHEFPPYQLVDVHIALEAWTEMGPGRSFELVGVAGERRRYHPLSELLVGRSSGVGPVEYVDLADAPDSTRSCVRFGIFLLIDGDHKAAVLLRGEDPHGPLQSAMLEILDSDQDAARRLLTELRRLAIERSVLRRQVLALGPGEGHQYGHMRFLPRPSLTRDGLVLPDDTLAQIERHVLDIARHGPRLRAAGQHLKRGVLLYGPPGTGKTHTVRYLLSRMTDMTVLVLSGQSLGAIGQACALARLFQPSMVIMEDVDLIASDRSFGPIGGNPLLFEVLNQLDGLGDDVDVTFLLTTNRVDVLEQALAERPGRVDAAVEIAPPDPECRRQLLRLYGGSLGLASLSDAQLAEAVAATEGRTATYLREVVRRAALLAADRQTSGDLSVDSQLLAQAANDLLDDRSALTRALLGGADEPDAEPPFVSPAPMNTLVRHVGFGPPIFHGGTFLHGRPFSGDQPPPFAPDEGGP